MTYEFASGGRGPGPRKPHIPIDFDVGEAEVVEQSSFEIEEITLTGEHHAVVDTELVAEITITGEHRAIDGD